MEFEDVLEELGGFGRFQKILLWFFLLPSQFLLPFFSMNLIFLLSEPPHHCVVPDLDALGLNASRVEQVRKLVVSEDECSMFPLVPFNATLLPGENAFDGETWNLSRLVNQSAEMQPCERFRYDDQLYDETVPTKWDLVCSRGHLPSLVYTVGTVGGVIGTLVFGAMADKCGRKRTLYVIVTLAVFSGFGTVLSTSFIVFVAMRFIKTLLDTQMEQLPYVLLMELVGAEQRTLMLGVTCLGWTLGMCLLPLVVYLSRTWVILLTVCTCCSLPMFCYWKILPESPRWLLSQNRLPEASAILRRVAAWNRVKPPPDLDEKLRKAQHHVKAEDEAESSGSMLDVFTKPKIRKHLLILTVIWSANSSVYGTMHINATNLSGNEFLNFFYLALVEIPATAIGWWSMGRFGRRWTNVFFMLLTASSCWAPIISPTSTRVASIVAKFSATAAYMMMYQQSDELFPTPVRSFSVGVITALAGTFTAVMPSLVYLSKHGGWIPFLFLALLVTAAGIAASFLPETRGYPLCQTVEDAEKFGADQKFFSLNRAEELRKRSKGVDDKDANGVELSPLKAEA